MYWPSQKGFQGFRSGCLRCICRKTFQLWRRVPEGAAAGAGRTGEQGGEQEQAALSAGLQGMGRGQEGAALLSRTLQPHSIIGMFTQCAFPSLEVRGCCKQQCALKPRSTWGLSFTALQQLHFIHCHYENVLLYFREMNQSKSGLRFLETLFLWVLLLGRARKIL